MRLGSKYEVSQKSSGSGRSDPYGGGQMDGPAIMARLNALRTRTKLLFSGLLCLVLHEISTRLHGVTSQMTVMSIVISVGI
jgi:hypothetical protein